MTRFEPATSGSTDRRSNQLSYIHHKSSIVIILIFGRFCQKNFPPRFCKPGRTNKQPLIKSAAGHKNPAGARNSKRSRKPHRARPKHINSAGSARSTKPRPKPTHPAGRAIPNAHANPAKRAFCKATPCKHRRALPHYLDGTAVCGAGKWRRLWRTWFCASTRSSAGHKHICKNLSILCWLPPKKVSCR